MHKFLIHNHGDHVGVATSDIEAGEKVIGVFMDDNTTIEVEAHHDWQRLQSKCRRSCRDWDRG